MWESWSEKGQKIKKKMLQRRVSWQLLSMWWWTTSLLMGLPMWMLVPVRWVHQVNTFVTVSNVLIDLGRPPVQWLDQGKHHCRELSCCNFECVLGESAVVITSHSLSLDWTWTECQATLSVLTRENLQTPELSRRYNLDLLDTDLCYTADYPLKSTEDWRFLKTIKDWRPWRSLKKWESWQVYYRTQNRTQHRTQHRLRYISWCQGCYAWMYLLYSRGIVFG